MNYPYNPMMPMMQPPFGGFVPMNKTSIAPPLYVGDLDENIHEEYLHDFFSRFGPVHFVRIMKDRSTGKSRGFAYVNFVNPRDAETARDQAQYAKLGRKYIRVAFKNDEIKDLPNEGNIFVKNVDKSVTPRDLHNHFSQVGHVISAKVATDKKGESLGYGYVQYEKKEDAEAAIEKLQGSILKETELQLESFLSKGKRGDEGGKKNLYVKDFPENKSEDELRELTEKVFAPFGEVESVFMKKHPTEDKYSAFVSFKEEEDAEKAVEELTKNPVLPEGADKPLYVNWHQGKYERSRQLKEQHEPQENNLYVKNLRPDVTEAEVKQAFQQYGIVNSVTLKVWESQQNKNQTKQAFIAFDNADDAKRAQVEAANVQDIQTLFIEGIAPYITMHQSREKRNDFLNSKGRRKQQFNNNFMVDPNMRQMPFPMPGRGFGQFPMMAMMNPQLQAQMRGGFKPHQKGGFNNKPQQQGGYQKPQNRQFQGGNPNYKGNVSQQQNKPFINKKVDNKPGQQKTQESSITSSGITVQSLKNKVGEFLQLDIDKQRQILGELLYPLIKPLAGDLAPKITGMLIDLSVLELSEILEFLEDPELLKERVFEARDLILEGGAQ